MSRVTHSHPGMIHGGGRLHTHEDYRDAHQFQPVEGEVIAVPLYRRRPITVEALQWDGVVNDSTVIMNWVRSHGGTIRYQDDPSALSIDTLEGSLTAVPGDWVVRGVMGEFHLVRGEIFGELYEHLRDRQLGEDV